MDRTDSTRIRYFIQNSRYKLHHDGRFIDKSADRFEKFPINANGGKMRSELESLKNFLTKK